MDKYYQYFNEYVAGYDLSKHSIWGKHEHTMRVIKNSKEIAKSLHLPYPAVELAELIGLFHDFGRFEQLRIYDSFDDFKTVDHADLGVQLIQEHGLLVDHPHYQKILTAIKFHDKFNIDPQIKDEETLLFCKIIRDADKLDIFRRIANDDIHIARITGEYDPEAFEVAASGKPLNFEVFSKDGDYVIDRAALFNDINFEYTKNCIENEFLLEKVIERFVAAAPEQASLLRYVKKAIKGDHY